MNKKEFDNIITQDYQYLKKKVNNFLNNKKTNAESDVIGWAYEHTLKSVDKIHDKKQLRQRFLQNCKMATIWTNSSYFKEYSKKEVKMSCEKVEYFSEPIEMEVNNQDIIGEYLKVCDRDDKMLISLINQGHNSCRKLSAITLIPRSTCHLMIKDLKERIKDFTNNK